MSRRPTLDVGSLHAALTAALESARAWSAGRDVPNTLRSARFVSEVARHAHPVVAALAPSGAPPRARHIRVDDDGRKHPGEWLLDLVWTVDLCPDPRMATRQAVPGRLVCAVESESDTSGQAWFIDLAKLVHVRSEVKLFLGGLDQTTPAAAEAYIGRRLEQTRALLTHPEVRDAHTAWFVAFWPSPRKHGDRSLWEQLALYPHLGHVRLFSLGDGGFDAVAPTPTGSPPWSPPAPA